MRKFYFIIILTLIIGCDVVTVEKYYTLAFELEQQERYEEAISFHDKALKKNSKFRPSLINRGVDKSALGDYNGAISDYKKILEFDSDNLLAMMNIGNNYESLNDFKSAIKYYSKALESKQVIKSSKFNIRIEYQNDFDKDYQYQVNDYELLFERGTAYLLDNQYEKAISDLRELIKTREMVGDAYFYIGESYLGLNDTLNACKNYKISVEKGVSNGRENIKKYCKEK
jgi:tetratricopeptide (TPR) repeat protein